MATWVIGDIHGCKAELDKALALMDLSDQDHLISVGDLLDRGPDSVGVVRTLRSLNCRFTLVMGNHESKHARFRKGNPVKDARGELREITQGLNAQDVRFLESAVLATQVVEGEQTYTIVHAGIPSYTRNLPLGLNDPISIKNHKWLTMVRYQTPEGNPVALGYETETDLFWTNTYDGRFGTVVYGHQPHTNFGTPVFHNNTIGIDLGCCFGGYLCAVRLGDQKFITVKAERQYSRPHGTEE
jgi:hypothetical protein